METFFALILELLWVFGIMEVTLLAITIVLLAMHHWFWALVPGLPALVVLGLIWWAHR